MFNFGDDEETKKEVLQEENPSTQSEDIKADESAPEKLTAESLTENNTDESATDETIEAVSEDKTGE